MAALNVGTTEAMQRQHASDADCFALPARSLQQALYSLHAHGMVTVMALSGFVDNLSYLYSTPNSNFVLLLSVSDTWQSTTVLMVLQAPQ